MNNTDHPIVCRECGVAEGQLHERSSCLRERCPFCGRQSFTCNCQYRILDIDCSPGTNAYENGLTDKQLETFEAKLEERGRIPFIKYPNLCARCGCKYPEMFRVSNEEWQRYIEPAERDKILCRSCYDEIKKLIDEGSLI